MLFSSPSDLHRTMTADTFPRIDHIIIAAKDVRVAAKHFLDTYGLASEFPAQPARAPVNITCCICRQHVRPLCNDASDFVSLLLR